MTESAELGRSVVGTDIWSKCFYIFKGLQLDIQALTIHKDDSYLLLLCLNDFYASDMTNLICDMTNLNISGTILQVGVWV